MGGDQNQAEVQRRLGSLPAKGEGTGRISLTLAVLGGHLTMEISCEIHKNISFEEELVIKSLGMYVIDF